MKFKPNEITYLKTILAINKDDIKNKLQYIESKGAKEQELLNDIKKCFNRQLKKIISIEKKINKMK